MEAQIRQGRVLLGGGGEGEGGGREGGGGGGGERKLRASISSRVGSDVGKLDIEGVGWSSETNPHPDCRLVVNTMLEGVAPANHPLTTPPLVPLEF